MGGLASGKEATKLLRETPNMVATALWSIVLIAPQRGQRPRALRLQYTVAVTPITRELALAEQGKVYVSEEHNQGMLPPHATAWGDSNHSQRIPPHI